MQEEALDFSLKTPAAPPTSHSSPELSPISPISTSTFGQPYFGHPLDDAHRHLMEQFSPFALLSSSGSIAVSNLASHLPPAALMTNQLLPTTSLALTTLHRRRRRISSGSGEEFATAKKLRSIPEERKDDAYWERRRKNNEAAKRSRDARKAKEDEIAFRAAYLEQENLKLKAQLTMLKSEMSRLQSLLFTQSQQ